DPTAERCIGHVGNDGQLGRSHASSIVRGRGGAVSAYAIRLFPQRGSAAALPAARKTTPAAPNGALLCEQVPFVRTKLPVEPHRVVEARRIELRPRSHSAVRQKCAVHDRIVGVVERERLVKARIVRRRSGGTEPYVVSRRDTFELEDVFDVTSIERT